jgi:hypothetical protein
MNIEVECVDDGVEGFYRVFINNEGACFESSELSSAFHDAFTFLGFNINYKDVEEFGEIV